MNLLSEIYNKLIITENVSVNSITDSINNLYQVVMNYEGDPAHGIAPGLRTVEVYAYGLTKAGNPVIRAYQPYGDTASKVPNWKFFRLDRIKSWKPTYRLINKPAPDFNPNGDGSMSVVYSIANFNQKPISNISGPRRKEVGNLPNIDKILADREKDKQRKTTDIKTISKFKKPLGQEKVGIKNNNIQEPDIKGIENTIQQEIPNPDIKGINKTSDEDNFSTQDNSTLKKSGETQSSLIKTRGEEEIEKMKDLSRRMDTARKIDLNKIPRR